jgi:hypothetical protein
MGGIAPPGNAAKKAAFTAAMVVFGTYATKLPPTVAKNAAARLELPEQAWIGKSDAEPSKTINAIPPFKGIDPLRTVLEVRTVSM